MFPVNILYSSRFSIFSYIWPRYENDDRSQIMGEKNGFKSLSFEGTRKVQPRTGTRTGCCRILTDITLKTEDKSLVCHHQDCCLSHLALISMLLPSHFPHTLKPFPAEGDTLSRFFNWSQAFAWIHSPVRREWTQFRVKFSGFVWLQWNLLVHTISSSTNTKG